MIKSRGPKVFFGIGGYTKSMGYENYSDMAASDTSRAQFVKNVVKLVDLYGFDGFLPEWYYPGCPNVGLKFHVDTITDDN